ncbi:MAG: hypothetical protein KKA81_17540 [Bacteroidetes bacterium]|nr:hypothetical protein [Bacteroidota bacterium]
MKIKELICSLVVVCWFVLWYYTFPIKNPDINIEIVVMGSFFLFLFIFISVDFIRYSLKITGGLEDEM